MRYGADRDPDRRHERLDLDATRDEFGAEILIPRDIPVVGWVRHDSDRHLVSVTMYAEPGPGRVVVVNTRQPVPLRTLLSWMTDHHLHQRSRRSEGVPATVDDRHLMVEAVLPDDVALVDLPVDAGQVAASTLRAAGVTAAVARHGAGVVTVVLATDTVADRGWPTLVAGRGILTVSPA